MIKSLVKGKASSNEVMINYDPSVFMYNNYKAITASNDGKNIAILGKFGYVTITEGELTENSTWMLGNLNSKYGGINTQKFAYNKSIQRENVKITNIEETGMFLAVDEYGRSGYSENGKDWNVTSETITNYAGKNGFGVGDLPVYFKGHYYYYKSGYVLKTLDFNTILSAASISGFTTTTLALLITDGDNLYISTLNSNGVNMTAKSTDGTTWVNFSYTFTVQDPKSTTTSRFLRPCAKKGSSKVYVVSNFTYLYYSFDFINWSPVKYTNPNETITLPLSYFDYKLEESNGVFHYWCFLSSDYFYSKNGVDWAKISFDKNIMYVYYVGEKQYNNKRLIVMFQDGEIRAYNDIFNFPENINNPVVLKENKKTRNIKINKITETDEEGVFCLIILNVPIIPMENSIYVIKVLLLDTNDNSLKDITAKLTSLFSTYVIYNNKSLYVIQSNNLRKVNNDFTVSNIATISLPVGGAVQNFIYSNKYKKTFIVKTGQIGSSSDLITWATLGTTSGFNNVFPTTSNYATAQYFNKSKTKDIVYNTVNGAYTENGSINYYKIITTNFNITYGHTDYAGHIVTDTPIIGNSIELHFVIIIDGKFYWCDFSLTTPTFLLHNTITNSLINLINTEGIIINVATTGEKVYISFESGKIYSTMNFSNFKEEVEIRGRIGMVNDAIMVNGTRYLVGDNIDIYTEKV